MNGVQQVSVSKQNPTLLSAEKRGTHIYLSRCFVQTICWEIQDHNAPLRKFITFIFCCGVLYMHHALI
jgi:hypothetical protein